MQCILIIFQIHLLQDFDDWDDVGLNTSKPPDLLHLYRDYGQHQAQPCMFIQLHSLCVL